MIKSTTTRFGVSFALVLAFGGPLALSSFAQQAPAAPSAASFVPKDLKPLLLGRQSEMRIPVQWYTADRQTLSQNFLPATAGGGRGGGRAGGRGTAPSLSRNRIARLKRLDMDWQLALSRLDTARRSPAAQADLTQLKATIAANLAELDDDGRALAAMTPLVPFAADLVELYEARVRVDPIDHSRPPGASPPPTSRSPPSVHGWRLA